MLPNRLSPTKLRMNKGNAKWKVRSVTISQYLIAIVPFLCRAEEEVDEFAALNCCERASRHKYCSSKLIKVHIHAHAYSCDLVYYTLIPLTYSMLYVNCKPFLVLIPQLTLMEQLACYCIVCKGSFLNQLQRATC